MNLTAIKPVSITRLSRKPDSIHQDKPRLLKVVVKEEKELEDIILSAYLLRDGHEGSSRVFVDVPWSERANSPFKGGQRSIDKHDKRCLLILNVPETASDTDPQCRAMHDKQQWKYLRKTIQANNEVVVDMFRIPKSPRYEGNGSRPLKLTLLTASMADTVYNNWCRYRQKLPREIRIVRGSSKRPSETVPQPVENLNGSSIVKTNAKTAPCRL